MKKYPKLVQIDSRGQIVIPKDIRSELGIDEGTGFWVYSIENEGILLKKVDAKPLGEHENVLSELEEKAPKLKKRILQKQSKSISEQNKENLM